jgi:cell division inhibitor SepF
MAGFWHKVTDYLGLSDNESYGDYDYDDQPPVPPPARRPAAASFEPENGSVRTLPASDSGVGGITVQPRPTTSSSVRTLPVQPSQAAKVHVVAPTSFAEAQEIGEKFRSGTPVIINLTGVDRELQRRMVDFSSGVVFGLNGTMKKVADKVYMLTPSNVEVSADEKRRLQERGLYGS